MSLSGMAGLMGGLSKPSLSSRRPARAPRWPAICTRPTVSAEKSSNGKMKKVTGFISFMSKIIFAIITSLPALVARMLGWLYEWLMISWPLACMSRTMSHRPASSQTCTNGPRLAFRLRMSSAGTATMSIPRSSGPQASSWMMV